MKNQLEIFELIVYLGGFVGLLFCLRTLYYFFFGDKTTNQEAIRIYDSQKEITQKDQFTDWLIKYFAKESFKDFTQEDITNFFLENYENIILQCPHKINPHNAPLDMVHDYRKEQKECDYA